MPAIWHALAPATVYETFMHGATKQHADHKGLLQENEMIVQATTHVHEFPGSNFYCPSWPCSPAYTISQLANY